MSSTLCKLQWACKGRLFFHETTPAHQVLFHKTSWADFADWLHLLMNVCRRWSSTLARVQIQLHIPNFYFGCRLNRTRLCFQSQSIRTKRLRHTCVHISVIVVMATSRSYSTKCQGIQANLHVHTHTLNTLRHTEVQRRLDAFRLKFVAAQPIQPIQTSGFNGLSQHFCPPKMGKTVKVFADLFLFILFVTFSSCQ